MHRVIMKTPSGKETDHCNRNKLDNRRDNLRVVSTSINAHNKPMQNSNTSGYKNVSWDESRNKWRFTKYICGKQIQVRFDNIIDAIIYNDTLGGVYVESKCS